ncbi:hypothetical protein HC031_17005 [Planosporangium thailandense]|uniref:Uncharacterized protein n=1 Tax=Planosporangium thailandense TaxID=765197 RepID=A0ABX0XZB1_9ACTN|nr:DUF6010 family protein [Planosporangium thailandense]NJC71402.1 hypothetical protein [Planosporangium thailandense]
MTTTGTTAATAPVTRRAGTAGAIARRWPTGIGIAATATSLSLLAPLPERVQTWVSAWCVLLAAVVYLTWGAARGDLASRRLLSLQTGAVLGFGAIAIAAVAAEPAAARYVLAAGWLTHAAWDIAHHRADRVVPRWYAETCMVSDLIIATALLAVGSV